MPTKNFIILTGGPGAGKTTVLEGVAAEGYATMPEAGRNIIKAQQAVDGPALPWKDPTIFAEQMLTWDMRSHAAAVDNIALFFGEDIFIAIASILLIQGFLEQSGIKVEPLDLSRWAIPTAIAAFAIHSIRLWLLDRRLKRSLSKAAPEAAP